MSLHRAALLLPAMAAALLILFFRDAWQPALAGRVQRPAFQRIDIDSPVRLHGRVAKQGPVAALTAVLEAGSQGSSSTGSSNDDLRGRLHYPSDWHRRRQLGERSPPPAAYCPLFVNHRYKLIFPKSAKVGGTSIMSYFTTCYDRDVYGVKVNDFCLEFEDIFNATSARFLKDHWAEYFVFTFARSPLHRAVSQFQYLNNMMDAQCTVPWDEFCKDPFALGDGCRSNSACCTAGLPDNHHYVHVEPQANCLLTATGSLAVDFVGRLEALDEDFSQLVRILNSRRGLPQLPAPKLEKRNANDSPCTIRTKAKGMQQTARQLRWEARNSTFNPCDKRDYFRGRHAHCLSGLRSFYEQDFQILL